MLRVLIFGLTIGLLPSIATADIDFQIEAPSTDVMVNTMSDTTFDLLFYGISTGTEFGGFSGAIQVDSSSGISSSDISFGPAQTPATSPFSTATSQADGAFVWGSTALADQANLVVGQNNFFVTTVSVAAGQTGTITFAIDPTFTNFSSGGGFLPATIGGNQTVTVAVPEPSSCALLSVALAATFFRRKRS